MALTGYEQVKIDESTVVGQEGYYRAGKDTEGRWWFIRPDGRPFLYKGCCAVCDGIPPHGNNPGNAYWHHWHDKYGPEDDHKFALDAFRVLDDVGFNAWGMWCFIRNPHSGHEQMGWPYVAYIHAREIFGGKTVPGSFLKTVDVFDPAWERAYDKACAKCCPQHAGNTNMLGYFTDNEPFWGQPFQRTTPEEQAALAKMQDAFTGQTTAFESETRAHRWGEDSLGETFAAGTILQAFLNLPPDEPGHRKAWDFVLERHGGSIEQLAKDWEVDFTSPEDLRRRAGTPKEPGLVLNSPGYGEDHDAFTRLYVETYFRVTGESIRRYDPNHMRLGVRHHARAALHGEVALRHYEHVKQHVEVFSLNTYHDRPADSVRGYARWVDMPFLIGEYTWGGWIYDGQTYPPEWENDHEGWLRQEGVRRSAAMFAIPQLAGYTWFKWYCGCTDPDKTDAAVITDASELNRFNAPMLRKFHAAIEDVHAGVADPETL